VVKYCRGDEEERQLGNFIGARRIIFLALYGARRELTMIGAKKTSMK
jgi:hypothetical protein